MSAPVPLAGQTHSGASTAKSPARLPSWTPPRTSDGQPDLQGTWISNRATPLERPAELGARRLLTDGEVTELVKRANRLLEGGSGDYAGGDNLFLAALANVDHYKNPSATEPSADMVERVFDNRTSLIIDPPDGKIPPLTREGQARLDGAVEARRAVAPRGAEDLPADLRCITFGVPRLGGNYGAGPYSYYQILQSANYVVLHQEFIHESRIVPLDGRPHLPVRVRQWNGDSRGRWDGNTLVVETTNFSANSFYQGSREHLHLVERFTRVAPDAIDYQVTLTDPTTWTKPWTARIRLTETHEAIFESACHEGNSLILGILQGGRTSEVTEGARKQGSK